MGPKLTGWSSNKEDQLREGTRIIITEGDELGGKGQGGGEVPPEQSKLGKTNKGAFGQNAIGQVYHNLEKANEDLVKYVSPTLGLFLLLPFFSFLFN